MIIFISILSILCFGSLESLNYQSVQHWKYLKQDKAARKPSLFGYSLAVHRSSLIVGAPQYHSTHDIVARRGAVWKCEFQSDYNCQRVPFRLDGEVNVRIGTSFDNKTDQWLGASLAANNDNIIAGTPFLKHRIKDGKNLDYEIPGGALIGKFDKTISMSNNTQIFSPSFFNWYSRNYNQEGYGEFGFQVSLSQKPSRILISSPGSFYFRGGIHSLPILEENYIDTRHPFTAPHYTWRDANWLRYPSNYSSNEYDDWCYRGYALTVGNFNEDEDQEIVISVPRLDNYRGAVEIINSHLDEYSVQRLNGSQIGEYFGASLLVVDLNNDGLDDLLVGAPLHSLKKEGHIIPDVGRVVIFHQTSEHKLVKKQTIEGTDAGGRLGHALTNLGDIDHDGFNDVAISVPFINHGSSSIVRIHRGSKDGLIEEPSQILKPEGVKGFGWSLQGQFDFDNNGYKDLAVGSIHSEKVAIILAQPVLRLKVRLKYSPSSISLNCTSRSEQTCFVMTLCIHPVNSNHKLNKQNDLIYEIKLDHEKIPKEERMFFRDSNNAYKQKQLRLSQVGCEKYSMYMKEEIGDKFRPIRAHIEFSLVSRADSNGVSPILDHDSMKFDHYIPIQKDCGSDDACVPELQAFISKSLDEYRVGLDSKISLTIEVDNNGENSYDTQCFIKMPLGVEYVSADSSSINNLYCKLFIQSDRVIVCQLGNPLLSNQKIAIRVHTAVSNYSIIESDPLTFHINITSGNINSTMVERNVSIPISNTPNLILNGLAKPEQLSNDGLNRNNQKQNEIEISHTYTLQNLGPGDAKVIEMRLLWPLISTTGSKQAPSTLQAFEMPTIIRFPIDKDKKDRCHQYHFFNSNDKEIGHVNAHGNSESLNASTISSFPDLSSVHCHQQLCKIYLCSIDTLLIGETISIQLRATMKNADFPEDFDRSKPFHIISNATAQVKITTLNLSTSKLMKHTKVLCSLETQIPASIERQSQHWVLLIGISIAAGVILLIILVGVLWCCGFFKRNRPKYPIDVQTLVSRSMEGDRRPVQNRQAGRLAMPSESDELSTDNHDENEMMIHNSGDSLPIVVPQNSSRFMQQQQQRPNFHY